jgi:ribosomal protein S18 acetylase RimI-like enzyme
MNKIEPKIRRGKIEDAETLAPLSIKIFNDTFASHPLNHPEDMKAYIAEAFSLEQIRHELTDKDSIVFIVEVDGEMIGFAKMREHSTEHCISDPDPIEIQRFYIAQEFHGKGIANALMQECLSEAKRKNYQTIWLGVWEYNHRAQRFYEKLGFEKVGDHVFVLGTDAQTDLVMAKSL